MLTQRLAKLAIVGMTALVFAGCASNYDRRTNNAMMGAGLGAAAGAVASQGDPLFAVGGAAVGGLLGHVLTDDDRGSRGWEKDRRHRHASQRNYRRNDDRRHYRR